MKIKIRILALLIMVVFTIPYMASCGQKKLDFQGSALPQGIVGVAYSASIDTAKGSDNITYSLKAGSSLPDGLSLNGKEIKGIPQKTVDNQSFVIIADAEGFAVSEASFKITITEAMSLTYEGGVEYATINEQTQISLDTAKGASSITYSLVEGDLPEGLSFINGVISGTPTQMGEFEITVSASADNLESVSAVWIINITFPRITYTDFATEDIGYKGVYFTTSLHKATGASNINYDLVEDSQLPEGLSLERDGFLHGVPSKNGNNTFYIKASAAGYESAIAKVSLLIRREPEISTLPGTITYTGGKTIKGAIENAKFASFSSATSNTVATAVASNDNVITYSITEGALPEGINLYSNGTLYGIPKVRGDYTFSVTAEANNCESVTREYTMVVAEPVVEYAKSKRLDPAEVGTPYSYDIGDAKADGATITYKIKDTTPAPGGLTLSSNGVLSGVPTTSARSFSFTVIASAPGFSSAEASISIKIMDKEVVVSSGRFEAEYIDLTGLYGAGYSGSASQEQMVQPGEALGASNGKYVGYMHTQVMLEFKFKSSEVVSGVKFEIGLGCELGNITFTPKEFAIILNGIEINYGSFVFTGNSGTWSNFRNLLVAENVTLQKENTVALIVRENTFMKGQSTGGPGVDYIQMTSTSTLSWVPHLYNVK